MMVMMMMMKKKKCDPIKETPFFLNNRVWVPTAWLPCGFSTHWTISGLLDCVLNFPYLQFDF
jgi:hypothetical protein